MHIFYCACTNLSSSRFGCKQVCDFSLVYIKTIAILSAKNIPRSRFEKNDHSRNRFVFNFAAILNWDQVSTTRTILIIGHLLFCRTAMKLIVAYLLAVTAGVAMTQGLVCTNNFCANQTCNASVTTENCNNEGKIYKANATYCRCCAACLTIVEKGDICYYGFLRGTPPTSECVTGTTCVLNASNNTYTCQ
ncbi:uncharacterized protein LOC124301132 [Neodiprion virginianus]|uniref:uncharacterized protein LOC124301132 n=1 Tax=Neodiprion virginianus TaxID=2961670 RepID=UPI001EE74752|nr:uncharacterized protein LOC124301132 [Neodiprion virginianus]